MISKSQLRKPVDINKLQAKSTKTLQELVQFHRKIAGTGKFPAFQRGPKY
jgi:hypothetical protein